MVDGGGNQRNPGERDMSLLQNLVTGEKILWQGAPAGGIRFRRSDFLLIPFGLVFFGFSLFWETTAATMIGGDHDQPMIASIFPIFGIPFILVGFYLVIGRFFWDAYSRKRSTYVLTNRRALIETTAFGSKLISVTLLDLPEVALEQRADGSGTVVLGQDIQTGSGDNSRTKRAPRFEFIPDAQRVYKLVEEARSKGV
jgi:uncharacterized membrane protein